MNNGKRPPGEAKEASREPNPGSTIKVVATGPGMSSIDYARLPIEKITGGGRLVSISEEGSLDLGPEKEGGRYEIGRRLGSGGMGVIYSARQTSLDREVALKIHRTKATPETDTRSREALLFANEAFITASLDHPHVVPVHSLARGADGRLFFTMKRVTGITWFDLLHPDLIEDEGLRSEVEQRAAAMTRRDHAEILLKVADAVAFAHSRGILHRDLKPENVLIGEFGEVYVMDWGLAIYFDERNEHRRDPGRDPELTGTPHYMAPEMARGEVGKLTAATDVFLLGAILHEVITGEPPRRGSTVIQIIGAAAGGEYASPPTLLPDGVIDPSLALILEKALAAKMEDRYQSVPEFQAELRTCLDHAQSQSISTRALSSLMEIETEVASLTRERTDQRDRETASMIYGRLSETVGAFRQALGQWEGNGDARQGLFKALALQAWQATRVGDLAMARAQLDRFDSLPGPGTDEDFAGEVAASRSELSALVDERERRQITTRRQVRVLKFAAVLLVLLVAAGIGLVFFLLREQRTLAQANQRDLFVAAVNSRAQNVEQYMVGLKRTVAMYCRQATHLFALPEELLPPKRVTPAGRDGFYLDEDYYDPETRPEDMALRGDYSSEVSTTQATVVRAPWAREKWPGASTRSDANRLGRLSTLFLGVHNTRDDLQWSIAGTKNGLLAGFPGSGRYRDKPEYDPTKRAWFRAAAESTSDDVTWGIPYTDASTGRILLSCVCPVLHRGEFYGAVGVEVALSNIRDMLLEFTEAFGENTRCILLRPFQEENPTTGRKETVYRAIVDTAWVPTADDWEDDLELPRAEQVNPCVAAYMESIHAGRADAKECEILEDLLLAHRKFEGEDWVLIATTLNR